MPVRRETRAFGKVEQLALPFSDGAIDWDPNLVFPGLEEGEALDRRTRTAKRAAILAVDGTPWPRARPSAHTRSASRRSTSPARSAMPRRSLPSARPAGYPPGTPVGTSGLENAFDTGSPARRAARFSRPARGRRVAPRRHRAEARRAGEDDDRARPAGDDRRGAGRPVRRRRGPGREQRLRPGDRRARLLRAPAARLRVQDRHHRPPRSRRARSASTTTSTSSDAVTSAGGDLERQRRFCGGSFTESFADSCNSVFAPLGARSAARSCSRPPRTSASTRSPLFAPRTSRDARTAVDDPDPIGSEIDVAVTAIGQGEVLATPLQMATVAQTIANGGVRSRPRW